MARPLPVNLLFAGTGAVLLVSAIGGETIGEVLRGSFGEHLTTGKTPATKGAADTGEGTFANVSDTGEASPVTGSFPVSSNFAPSPTTFNRQPTKRQENLEIAHLLYERGITNPTDAQIEAARKYYEKSIRGFG